MFKNKNTLALLKALPETSVDYTNYFLHALLISASILGDESEVTMCCTHLQEIGVKELILLREFPDFKLAKDPQSIFSQQILNGAMGLSADNSYNAFDFALIAGKTKNAAVLCHFFPLSTINGADKFALAIENLLYALDDRNLNQSLGWLLTKIPHDMFISEETDEGIINMAISSKQYVALEMLIKSGNFDLNEISQVDITDLNPILSSFSSSEIKDLNLAPVQFAILTNDTLALDKLLNLGQENIKINVSLEVFSEDKKRKHFTIFDLADLVGMRQSLDELLKKYNYDLSSINFSTVKRPRIV